MCNPVRDTQPAHRSPYDLNECGSSHALNAIYSVEHRLADCERRRERRVCFTQMAREGKFHLFSPPLDSSALEGERRHLGCGGELGAGGCTRRREVDLEERSGLGGDMNAGVGSTLGRCVNEAHLTWVHLEDMTARSTPGGSGGHADLTGTEDKAGRVSTVSLIRDEGLGTEDTGS